MCCHTEMSCRSDTGHDTPPHHSIQTRGRPVVLSIDVERYTGIHNCPLQCLGLNAQLYDTDMVVVIMKLGRKCTVPTGSGVYVCKMQHDGSLRLAHGRPLEGLSLELSMKSLLIPPSLQVSKSLKTLSAYKIS